MGRLEVNLLSGGGSGLTLVERIRNWSRKGKGGDAGLKTALCVGHHESESSKSGLDRSGPPSFIPSSTVCGTWIGFTVSIGGASDG